MSDDESQTNKEHTMILRSDTKKALIDEPEGASEDLQHGAEQYDNHLYEDEKNLVKKNTYSDDKPSNVNRDYMVHGSHQRQEEFFPTKPRQERSFSPKQQRKESFSSKQTQEESFSTKQQLEESFLPKQLQVESFSPKQQRKASFFPKRPEEESFSTKQPQEPSPPGRQQRSSSPKTWYTNKYFIGVVVALVSIIFLFSNGDSNSSAPDIDWRSKVDPDNSLSNDQQSTIRASLKLILDKSYKKDQDVGVSTLLILSSDEKSAAKLAQCLLEQVNKKKDVNKISTEINLNSHSGGKLQLDTNLRTLLNTTDDIRAVLLRDIGNIPLKDTLDQLRLLFAYCDGENPVIPHRLIIMTATSISETEDELRQSYKNKLPNEHDFIDALMSRISGHTLYVEEGQKLIC